MIIIHDLVEVYAGDMPSFEAAAGGQAEKEELESAAMEKLLKKVPSKKLTKEIVSLWNEFEGKQTIESKFAQSCDKAEAIIQHNLADIKTFEKGDYDINPFYKNNLFDFDKFMREFKDELDQQTMGKIEDEGDVSKVSDEHMEEWKQLKSKLNI